MYGDTTLTHTLDPPPSILISLSLPPLFHTHYFLSSNNNIPIQSSAYIPIPQTYDIILTQVN